MARKKHIVESVTRMADLKGTGTLPDLPEVVVKMASGSSWTFRRGYGNKVHLMYGGTSQHPEYPVAREAAVRALPTVSTGLHTRW